MTPIDIKIPGGAEVASGLYVGMELEDLTQDLVTVRLPNGYFIDMGWYPEHDPAGQYVVRVFWQFWDRQVLDSPYTTPGLDRAVLAVETLAERFSRSQVPMSRAKASSRIPTISV
jgi:hypothetical protein